MAVGGGGGSDGVPDSVAKLRALLHSFYPDARRCPSAFGNSYRDRSTLAG